MSAGPAKLTPSQQLRAAYSDGDRGRMTSDSKPSSPMRPVSTSDLCCRSSWGSVSSSHPDAHLGQDVLHPREPLEHARQQHVDHAAAAVELGLGDPDQRRCPVTPVVGHSGAARVLVHRHLQVLAHGPQLVVRVGVERLDVRCVRRDRRDEDAAPQPGFGGPLGLGDGVVHVVEEDLRDARPDGGGARRTSRPATGCAP